MKKYISTFIAIVLLVSCVRTPNEPAENDFITGEHGLFILCEGLWGSDNATIDRCDLASGVIINQYFRKANPGLRLGDTASDIAIKGDSVFVSVSTSSTIEVFNKINGKFIGRIFLLQNSQPRDIVIINDTVAYVTLLFKNAIAEFNPRTLSYTGKTIPVGPFPEGITFMNNYLFVANSGYGDFFHNAPKAGELSIVDYQTGKEIKSIFCGKNLIEVIANPKNQKIYAAYYNLPSLVDSLGGIAELDSRSLEITRHWRLRPTDLTFSPNYDTLYFLQGNTTSIDGVYFIDLNKRVAQVERKIKNINPNAIWYSLSISSDGGLILVGNAKRFTSNGELLIFKNQLDSIPVKKFTTGINPNRIVFF
jgi:DNA-binding beta-propeller fold protein YncE